MTKGEIGEGGGFEGLKGRVRVADLREWEGHAAL